MTMGQVQSHSSPKEKPSPETPCQDPPNMKENNALVLQSTPQAQQQENNAPGSPSKDRVGPPEYTSHTKRVPLAERSENQCAEVDNVTASGTYIHPNRASLDRSALPSRTRSSLDPPGLKRSWTPSQFPTPMPIGGVWDIQRPPLSYPSNQHQIHLRRSRQRIRTHRIALGQNPPQSPPRMTLVQRIWNQTGGRRPRTPSPSWRRRKFGPRIRRRPSWSQMLAGISEEELPPRLRWRLIASRRRKERRDQFRRRLAAEGKTSDDTANGKGSSNGESINFSAEDSFCRVATTPEPVSPPGSSSDWQSDAISDSPPASPPDTPFIRPATPLRIDDQGMPISPPPPPRIDDQEMPISSPTLGNHQPMSEFTFELANRPRRTSTPVGFPPASPRPKPMDLDSVGEAWHERVQAARQHMEQDRARRRKASSLQEMTDSKRKRMVEGDGLDEDVEDMEADEGYESDE